MSKFEKDIGNPIWLLICIIILIIGITLGIVTASYGSNNWISILSALLTPTIAVAGTAVAAFQWRINQNRLQHELFDRRIKIFETIASYVANAISRGTVQQGEEFQFLRETKHVIFLFDKEIANYVDDIYKKSVDLQFLSDPQNQLSGDALNKAVRKRKEVFEWFTNELNNLPEKFKRFLQL